MRRHIAIALIAALMLLPVMASGFTRVDQATVTPFAGVIGGNGQNLVDVTPVTGMTNGSGIGVYNSTSTSWTAVDSTNLGYAATVASGNKMICAAHGSVQAAVANSVSVGIAVDGIVAPASAVTSGINGYLPFATEVLFKGDGGSHAFKLYWTVSGGKAWMKNTSQLAPYFRCRQERSY